MTTSNAVRISTATIAFVAGALLTTVAMAAGSGPEPMLIAGVPVDFILFALTLLGVAVFSNQT